MEIDLEMKTKIGSVEGKTIFHIPEEILEYILLKLSPYRDLKSAMLVCKAWSRLGKGVMKLQQQNFLQKVYEGKLNWTAIQPEIGSMITERYSHCCCYYDKSVYVFGGCTSTNTTLNDLWRFDLARREWIRPLATGTYPFPKACATMVVYKDSLVLFGGWSHPTPFHLHQAARFFSELHIYSPPSNRWSHIQTLSHESPKPMAGHSASVIRNMMVVFGGTQAPQNRINDVWVFNFDVMSWKKQLTSNIKPSPRYGQSQITIDDDHIFFLGGCGGPNQIFSDFWLLTLKSDEPWLWEEIKVNNKVYGVPQIWCHPACKVGNMAVVLSKSTSQTAVSSSSQPTRPRSGHRSRVWIPPRAETHQGQRSIPRLANQNNEHEDNDVQSRNMPEALNQSLNNIHSQGACETQSEPIPSTSISHVSLETSESFVVGTTGPRPGMPSIRPNAMKNRQKQLETLLKYEKKLRKSSDSASGESDKRTSKSSAVNDGRSTNNVSRTSCTNVHVLDLSKVVSSKEVTWRPICLSCDEGSPEKTIFYSLVQGRGELIMFGGIEKDIQTMQRGVGLKSHVVSNTLYLLTPPEITL
ncbi:hypothetical protein ACJMK2_008707 [Sinanodonta woodiana]|uniref:F-box domain-containing protein n=1 Tax=Sinanodonta woodiana TaxID=1069815 RepID=A0ABD3VMD9_SINWO